MASQNTGLEMLLRRSALALLSVLCGFGHVPAAAAPPAGYYLVWADEFNANSLDTNKWDYWLPGTWRDAVNSSSAVSLNGSNLVITTYTSGGVNYTAMLASEHHFRPRYGYYEASIKWRDTNGMWSAFWLRSPTMGTYLDDAFVSGAEMDVAEHRYVGIYGTNIANIVSCNIHWNGYGSAEQSAGSPNVGTGLASGFHTYGLLWKTGLYSFSIDNSQVWDGTPASLFGSDAYVILSSEVDDTSTAWAGYIPPGGYGSQAASATKMTVDYFRYYAPTNVLFWTGANSVYWTNSANWVSNLTPLASSDLTFSYLSSSPSNVLGHDYTVDGLIFLNMTNNASINGTNTLTLGAGGIDMVAADHNATLNAPVSLAANQWWTVGRNNPGNVLTLNASLAGAATLTKAGYGNLILNGSNSFSGVLNLDTGSSTNDGTLTITRSAALSNVASPIFIRNTGAGVSTLQLSNSVAIAQNINLAGRDTNVAAIEASGPGNSLAGELTLAGGGSYYLLQCDAGTLTLAGTISAGSTATGVRSLTLQGNGNFSISGSIQNGSASALNVIKTNSGSLTLSALNTYTGATTNSRGNLFVNGSIAGTLVVNGGTLSGTGSIAGDATLPAGELSPGSAVANSIGALSFGGNLTLGSHLLTLMEIDAVTQTNDRVNVAATLTYGGTLDVVNLEGSLSRSQSFKLFNAASYAGSFSTLSLPSLDPGLAWNTDHLTNGILSVVPIPEMVSITNLGGGQLQLNWAYGTLQIATNVAGPYSDRPGATAPYTVPATNAQQFYRIREW